MFFPQISATLALVPMLTMGAPAVSAPAIDIAQTQDPYANWSYLYEDTFENNAGQTITRRWWLSPETRRQNNLLEFTLLARRSPASSNGTTAAVFDYIADCETISYSMETVTFLDNNNSVLDTQTQRQVMEPADPNTNPNFYSVLDRLCKGEL